jgi:hypothetical protein
MAKETKKTFSGKTKDLTFDVFDEKVLKPGAGRHSVTTMLRVYGAIH